MSEKAIKQEILLRLGSQPDIRLFKNDIGVAELKDGSWVKYGLFPGSSDLIGWRRLTILPEHVGKTVAVFLGAEIKTPTGRIRPNQLNWMSQVRFHGGIAEVLRSTEDTRLITEWRPSV